MAHAFCPPDAIADTAEPANDSCVGVERFVMSPSPSCPCWLFPPAPHRLVRPDRTRGGLAGFEQLYIRHGDGRRRRRRSIHRVAGAQLAERVVAPADDRVVAAHGAGEVRACGAGHGAGIAAGELYSLRHGHGRRRDDADPELTAAVVAPARHAAVAGERAGVVGAADEARRHHVAAEHAVSRQRRRGVRGGVTGAELSVGVVPPAVQLPIGGDGAGVLGAGADVGHRRVERDASRRGR